MIISLRLNEEDVNILQNLTLYFQNQRFPINVTKSDTIRACIRLVYKNLNESNKKDNT